MKNPTVHKAFSLIELLVSIAIIAVITGLSMAAYGKFTAHAQSVRCVELVHQIKTALEYFYQQNDYWPAQLLVAAKGSDGKLDKDYGAAFAAALDNVSGAGVKLFSYDFDVNGEPRLKGHDRLGVVTPWAMDYITHHDAAEGNSKLPAGGTINDHILHFAIDGAAGDPYDGITEVAHGYDGGKASVRAQACVWSYGRDGKKGTKDDIRSWSKGQEVSK